MPRVERRRSFPSDRSPRVPPPPTTPAKETPAASALKANVGVELKGVRSGVERRRGVSGLKARDPGRRETTGSKVLKKRRSPRRRGRMGTSVRQNAPSAAAATADGASPVAAETRPRNGGGDASTTAAYFFTTSEDAAYVFATFSRRSRVGDGYGSFAGGGGDVGDDVVVVDVGFFWSRSFAAFAFAFFASSRFSCFAIARSRPSSVSAVNTLGAIFIGSDVTAAPASFTDAIADDQKRSTPACHSSAAIALPSSLRLVSIAACFASAGRG
eukprot:30719-Pelagococcus_subviridis.AAC.4